MFKGRLSKQTKSLWDCLSDFMGGAKKRAEAIPADPDQNAMLKTRKLDGSSVEAWVNSPGLRPPK